MGYNSFGKFANYKVIFFSAVVNSAIFSRHGTQFMLLDTQITDFADIGV